MQEHVGPEADALVFTNTGGPLRRAGFRRNWWQPAVRKADLAPLSFHELRHTFVSLWIAAGANAKEVSMRAGHSSVAFTLDRYGHLYQDQDDAIADRLDDPLG
ncbi:MAG: tyrosine-type recombinase/integrase, partial [Egibacteraceae bacterium]